MTSTNPDRFINKMNGEKMDFDVTLKGYDANTDETDDLVKWISAPSRELLDRFLQETGLLDHVQSVTELGTNPIDFDDGLDLKLYCEGRPKAVQVADSLWYELSKFCSVTRGNWSPQNWVDESKEAVAK